MTKYTTGIGKIPILLGANENKSRTAVAIQLFADAMQRIDTILLEIRHLQTNLIYALREPDLNGVLRLEESYIFGSVFLRDTGMKSWSWLFANKEHDLGLKTENLHVLGRALVPTILTKQEIQYGMQPVCAKSDDNFSETVNTSLNELGLCLNNDDLVIKANNSLKKTFSIGKWNDVFDGNINLFCALQLLKRNLLIDKLHLCWWGHETFESQKYRHHTNSVEQQKKLEAQFLLVRGVIFDNLRVYIERLAELHSQFEKTLDLGSQENHRPITGRREEQGLYHYLLSEQTKEIFQEVSHLFKELMNSEEKHYTDPSVPPIVIHRWNHDFTSTNQTTIDLAGSLDKIQQWPKGADGYSYGVHTINTSFWMLDRPDLVPVIAHECVHSLIRQELNGLFDLGNIQYKKGEIFDFLRLAIKIHESYGFISPAKPKINVRELLADMMAAAIFGHSYLFALFQEIMGDGAEALMGNPEWGELRDISLADNVIENGFLTEGIDVDWYFRIAVLCEWLQLISDDEKTTTLEKQMLIGIIQSNENLYEQMHGLAQGNSTFGHWKEYAKDLISVIRISGIDKVVKKTTFNKNSTLNNWDKIHTETSTKLKEYFIYQKAASERRVLNQVMMHGEFYSKGPQVSQPDIVMQSLSDRFCLAKKSEIIKALHDRKNTSKAELSSLNEPPKAVVAIHCFKELYLGNVRCLESTTNIKFDWSKIENFKREHVVSSCESLPLFERLYDIPWQSAFIRSMDRLYFLSNKNLNQTTLIDSLSRQFQPGQKLMQYAQEVWCMKQRTTKDRVRDVVRLIYDYLGYKIDQNHFGNRELSDTNDARDEVKKVDNSELEDWVNSNTPYTFLYEKIKSCLNDLMISKDQNNEKENQKLLKAIESATLKISRNVQDFYNSSLQIILRDLKKNPSSNHQKIIEKISQLFCCDALLECGKINDDLYGQIYVYGSLQLIKAQLNELKKRVNSNSKIQQDIKDELNRFIFWYYRKLSVKFFDIDVLSKEIKRNRRYKIQKPIKVDDILMQKIHDLARILKSDENLREIFLLPLRSLVYLAQNFDQFEKFASRSTSKDVNGLRQIRSLTLSKISLINSHWWKQYDQTQLPYGQVRSSNSDTYPRDNSSLFATLGRYDYFILGDTGASAMIRNPFLDLSMYGTDGESLKRNCSEKEGNPFSNIRIKDENFSCYFRRIEHALGVKICGYPIDIIRDIRPTEKHKNDNSAQTLIDKNNTNTDTQKNIEKLKKRDKDVLAFMTVRVNGRPSKWEFLNRVRMACFKWNNFRDMNSKDNCSKEKKPFGYDESFSAEKLNAFICEKINEDDKLKELDFTPETLPKFRETLLQTKKRLQDSSALLDLPLELSGMFFEEGDNAFLGEGWGDITLVFLADKKNEYNPDEYKDYLTRRLYDIFALQKIIFQDFQVFRTELFFRPLALDAAKFDKKKRYSVIQSVRCRDDVNLSSGFSPIITSVEKHISDNSNDCYDLSQAVILNHIPGRNDIELSIPDLNNYFDIKAQANAENSDNESLHTPSETLKAIHALTGAQNQEAGVGFEEIITRVGFKHDLKPSGS